MARIEVIGENEAEGNLLEIYNSLRNKRGKVANIMMAQSLNPEAMRAHLDLYMALMFSQSGLSREEREMLATYVSALNGCDYCKSHHGAALMGYWKDRARVDSFIEKLGCPELQQRDLAILRYAEKLTRDPGSSAEDDTLNLRDAGFSDRDILDITMIVGYFNFVNRIALGLGVEFSEEEIDGYKV